MNGLFVLSFRYCDNDPSRNSFTKYYMPLLEIKDCNALIVNKPVFDQAVEDKQETYEKFVKMSIDDGYIIGDLLHYLYYQKYYKHVGIDLSRQKI